MAADASRKRRKTEQPVDVASLGLEIGNVPPQALEAEEGVLGAMLLEPSCVDQAMEELTASSFCDPKHRMIFSWVLADW